MQKTAKFPMKNLVVNDINKEPYVHYLVTSFMYIIGL